MIRLQAAVLIALYDIRPIQQSDVIGRPLRYGTHRRLTVFGHFQSARLRQHHTGLRPRDRIVAAEGIVPIAMDITVVDSNRQILVIPCILRHVGKVDIRLAAQTEHPVERHHQLCARHVLIRSKAVFAIALHIALINKALDGILRPVLVKIGRFAAFRRHSRRTDQQTARKRRTRHRLGKPPWFPHKNTSFHQFCIHYL